MSVLPGSRSSVLVPLLVLALLATSSGGLALATHANPGLRLAALSTCAGPALLTAYTGTWKVEGGPLPASAVDHVPLSYGYSAEVTWRNTSTGAVETTDCESITATTESANGGSFSLQLPLPNASCDRYLDLCSSSSGPYGPFALMPTSPPPSGYLTSVTRNGSSVVLAYVAELASLVLTPSSPGGVYSADAPGSVELRALTGNGSLTPASPDCQWALEGNGWVGQTNTEGSLLNLTASPTGGTAVLTATANLSVNGTLLTAGPVTLTLEALATSISAAGANRTSVDAGRPITVLATATGAAGYAYTGRLLPGLGLAAIPLACNPAPPVSGVETLACSASVVYPSNGTADPSVTVSNGYSQGVAILPEVAVLPPPAVEVAPTVLVGYAGAALTIQVQARAGTGAGPYEQACFDPGVGVTECSPTEGPNWTFRPTYDSPGTYTATAWTQDADGAIARIPLPVTIVEAPHLLPTSTTPPTAAVGTPVNLSVNLTGGLLPGTYWWNISGANRSLAYGAVLEDGPLSTTWIPTLVGPQYLSLTVVDALGTEVDQAVSVSVVPDPATSLPAVELPPGDPVLAGSPIPLAWQAYNARGGLAVTFAPTIEITLTYAPGHPVDDAWVNASGAGPLRPEGPGEFSVPHSAWTLGRLNLTVASTTAGPLEIALVGAGLPPSYSNLTVNVGPDLDHLQLFDPNIVLAGDRANRTFWHVQDEYGNPADGASLEVEFESGGTYRASTAPVFAGPDGSVGVWVNYSMPSNAGGTLEVLSGLHVLLGPVAIPAAPAGSGGPSPLVALGSLLLIGAVGLAVLRQVRRRPRRPPEEGLPSDASLEEFVTGRDRVIATVREAGAADLTRIEQSWGTSTPPADLADWVASLVADGTLGARTGPDGVARFCLTGPRSGPAHVILDEAALERATRARSALLERDDDAGDEGASN